MRHERLPSRCLRVLGALLMLLLARHAACRWACRWAHDDGLRHVCAIVGRASPSPAALLLWGGLRRYKRELQPRHGILLVSLTWVLLPLFATLPLMLALDASAGRSTSPHAYFEAVSGLTTTGATVLAKLDALPVSINVWRTFLQWLGGMGILVLAVAILPLLGVGGSQLFKAEVAGPIKDSKLTPRMKETAKGLWGIYVGLLGRCACWPTGPAA